MNNQRLTTEVPSATQVRAALDRVLASPPFSGSPQLIAFLRFVVEAALKGDADRIKSYTIAVEGLGRGPNFDPQSDPIVRVEAGRVRRALQHYYAGPGKADPVIIGLPLGSYIPSFRRRTKRPVMSLLGALRRQRPESKTVAWLLGAQVAVLAVGLIVSADRHWFRSATGGTGTVDSSPLGTTPAASLPLRSGMPIVAVQQIDANAAPRGTAMLEALTDKLRDALARFDEIEVVSELAPPMSSQSQQGVYGISVTAEGDKDDTIDLSFRLHDSSDGTVVWAQAFENVSVAASSADMNEVIRKIATVLAQPYGVIYARERAKLASNNLDPRYRCVLQAFEYWRGFDRSKTSEVRACLERVTMLDPHFAEGFAILGLLTLREYYEPEHEPSDTLDPAIIAAQRAVELKPQSARAHHALMAALFARNQIDAALAEAEKMIALNPNDMLAVQGYGMRLVLSGHLEKGTALLQQVAVSSPVRTPKFEFSLFLSEYMLGQPQNPAFQARLFTNDDYPLIFVARAVDAVRNGRPEQAQEAIKRLIALHPGWGDDPRRRLQRYIPSALIVDRLVRDLAAAGLPVSK